jgi:hypothetical protein
MSNDDAIKTFCGPTRQSSRLVLLDLMKYLTLPSTFIMIQLV